MKRPTIFSFILLLILAALAPQARSTPTVTPAEVGDRLVDLKKCIAYLEKTGNLVRVKSEVDAKHELAGIAKKYEGKKCVLFEKVKGSKFPVLMGLLWNRDTVGGLFNVPKERDPLPSARPSAPGGKTRRRSCERVQFKDVNLKNYKIEDKTAK